MIQNFCTLFNSAYLSRGLVLYESLRKHATGFHLYVFAFDEEVLRYFKEEKLPQLTVISLSEFEDNELLAVKSKRSATEYCWTCTASTIRYCLDTFQLEVCTYLDADMCFYANPQILIQEMGPDAVQITSHRYSAPYDQSAVSGKYCVQFVTFRNTPAGRKILESWRNDCLEWCYARVEEGRFGDQKYLDTWGARFGSVNELRHLGGGLAPWNLQQYYFEHKNGALLGKEKQTGKEFEVIFFHFHGLKFYSNNLVSYTDTLYEVSSEVKHLFYKPYVLELLAEGRKVKTKHPNLDPHGAKITSSDKPLSFVTLTVRYFFYLIKYGDISGRRARLFSEHQHLYRINY
jgi:hypothetical protein